MVEKDTRDLVVVALENLPRSLAFASSSSSTSISSNSSAPVCGQVVKSLAAGIDLIYSSEERVASVQELVHSSTISALEGRETRSERE
jgi:hypothetical protein